MQRKYLISRNKVIVFCFGVCHFRFCLLCLFYKSVFLCKRFTKISTKVFSFVAVCALVELVHLQARC